MHVYYYLLILYRCKIKQCEGSKHKLHVNKKLENFNTIRNVALKTIK